jgi:hypothetical protein
MAQKKVAQAILDMSGTARNLPSGADIATDDYLKQGYRPPPVDPTSGQRVGGASPTTPPKAPASTGLIRRSLGRTAAGAVAIPVAEQLIAAAVPAVDSGEGYGDLQEAMTFGTLPSDRPMRARPAQVDAGLDAAPRRAAAIPTISREELQAGREASGAITPRPLISQEESDRSYLRARALTGLGSGAQARRDITDMDRVAAQARGVSAQERGVSAAEVRNAISGLTAASKQISEDLKNPMLGLTKDERAALRREGDVIRRQLALITGGEEADAVEGRANGGVVGYADGGEVEYEDDMMEYEAEEPMAVNPTEVGKAAGMETGDYVFPVEAVQFYGLKMLKDMVKRAMLAE